MPPFEFKQYRRKTQREVVAVRLVLDTTGFTYRKWGGMQQCKRGDWIVQNGREVHTVDARSFARTYRRVSPGVYIKVSRVWARKATEDGAIPTKEGATKYKRGDFLVYNDAARKDGYAVSAKVFRTMYTLA